MKKIILAITLLVALSTASFASGNKADKKLLNDLTTTLKSSSNVQWYSTADYNRATFSFNGKPVFAFYYPDEDKLLGFSIHLTQSELPKEVLDAISKKYSAWSIVDAMLFINEFGRINYFAQVKRNKINLALQVINGHAFIYSKMPV